MTEFDIEAAKRGEPVEYNMAGGRWVPAHFVGVSQEGYMVIQHQITGSTKMTSAFCCQQSELRMAPKKIKVRYRNYKLCDVVGVGVSACMDKPREITPEKIEQMPWFRGWIRDEWQEAEITE